jgi:hypothetical protein
MKNGIFWDVTPCEEALSFSETSVLTRVTRRNIPEEVIFQSQVEIRTSKQARSKGLNIRIKIGDNCN